jgi:hypothetical protein
MSRFVILGVQVTDRAKKATALQKLFTKYGCIIKTRMGLHEVIDDYCSGGGLIVLDLIDDKNKIAEFKVKLGEIDGVNVKQMVFKNR